MNNSKNKNLALLIFLLGMNLCFSQTNDVLIIEMEKAKIDSLINLNKTYVSTVPQNMISGDVISKDFTHEDNPTYLAQQKHSRHNSIFKYCLPNNYVCKIEKVDQQDSIHKSEQIYYNSKGRIIYSEIRTKKLFYGLNPAINDNSVIIERFWINANEKKINTYEKEIVISGKSNSKEVIDLTPYKVELLFRNWAVSSEYINALSLNINDGYLVEVQIDKLFIQMNFRSTAEFMSNVGGDVSIRITDYQNRKQLFFIPKSSFSYKKERFVNGILKITQDEFENTNTISNFSKRSPIEFLDYNFDGYTDIGIFTNSSLGLENYNLYLFDKITDSYKYFPLELGGLTSQNGINQNKTIPMPLILDSINKVIQIKYPWAFPWLKNGTRERAYIWDNDVLRLVYERTRYREDDNHNIFVETWRNLKSGKWVVTTKKMQFENGEWKEFQFNEEEEY